MLKNLACTAIGWRILLRMSVSALCRWNPHWQRASVCVTFVFSQCSWVTQPPCNHIQMVKEKQREGDGEFVWLYLFLSACGGAQKFLQLCVHGALQLLPHHFLELSHPSFGHSFAQTWAGETGGTWGTWFLTVVTYLNSYISWILRMITVSNSALFIYSNQTCNSNGPSLKQDQRHSFLVKLSRLPELSKSSGPSKRF